MKELVGAAEVLEPPTDEEKEAMKALEDRIDANSKAAVEKWTENAEELVGLTEVIEAALKSAEKVIIPQHLEMMSKFRAIYGLEDNPKIE